MKSSRQYAVPAAAARRLLEIANTLNEYGWADLDKISAAFLREGASPAEYRAGIEKLAADGMIAIHPSGTRLYFTDKGAQTLT